MKITLRIFGDLAPILGRHHSITIDEGSTVSTLINKIAKQAGMKRQGFLGKYRVSGGDLAILINGRNIAVLDREKTVLQDGDEVIFLPPTAGG